LALRGSPGFRQPVMTGKFTAELIVKRPLHNDTRVNTSRNRTSTSGRLRHARATRDIRSLPGAPTKSQDAVVLPLLSCKRVAVRFLRISVRTTRARSRMSSVGENMVGVCEEGKALAVFSGRLSALGFASQSSSGASTQRRRRARGACSCFSNTLLGADGAYCLNSLNGSWQSCLRRKLRNRL
jgi:hypothetical protein